MNARKDMKSGSSIEQQISSINLSQRERDAALHYACIGEVFADAIMWVCSKFERPDAGVFVKPSPKY